MEEIVFPALMARGFVPRGIVTSAEGTSQDKRAGIDWLISARDGTQHTVASRVQWDLDYGTFTIRYRTERGTMSELTKRARSIANGGTYPGITIQAYVTQPEGVLLNAYVVSTRDLYQHVVNITADGDIFRLCSCAQRPKWVPGGAQMIAVAISEEGKRHAGTKSTLIACGVEVKHLMPVDEGRGLW
jgi:hypothetical protein